MYLKVPLGIVQHNENKIDEMTKIMDIIHSYVPSVAQVNHRILPNGDILDEERHFFHKTLLGGDQLTVARARGSKAIRGDHDSNQQRLDGLLPTVEDWHAKQCLLKVKLNFIYYGDPYFHCVTGNMEAAIQ